ncbi:MAG: endonuclease [Myxococcales bacterium]|nr:endonuclease [Myxococcales bacterium]
MKPGEIDEVLRETLEDGRLSRGEKKAISALFAEHLDSHERIDMARHRAFAVARERLERRADKELLDWLEEVVKAITIASRGEAPELAEAHFSPGEHCLRRILSLLRSAQREIDVCVFTITDDRITRELLAAHGRGVTVRIISDDDKTYDRGSDILELHGAGIPVRIDDSEYHMHHKFALFDRAVLVTGSYNWTRSAAKNNEENIIVSSDVRLLAQFGKEFDDLWSRFQPV